MFKEGSSHVKINVFSVDASVSETLLALRILKFIKFVLFFSKTNEVSSPH